MEGFISLTYTCSEISLGLSRRGFYLNFSRIKCPELPLRPFFGIQWGISLEDSAFSVSVLKSEDPLFI